ncbi:MAG: DinB family protein [Gemmatimonadota bacterium]|nr:MAG: DinB family protein [Gemmatimonadota bacterium]
MRIPIFTILMALAGSLALATPGAAQVDEPAGTKIDAEAVRAMLIRGFEQSRDMDLDYCRAMPDSALRWKPNPEVRDYAQQIVHISEGNLGIVAGAVMGAAPPSLGDSAVYLSDAAALEAAVSQAYDWVLEGLRDISAEELAVQTNLFGMDMAKWRVYNFALVHAYWTRGQLVPYVRAHGVQPPQYRPY